jgi:integrase
MTTTTSETGVIEQKPRKARKARGVGKVRLRGSTWWIDYHVHGKRYRESSESTVRSDAVELLRRRLAEHGKGRLVNPADEARLAMTDLFDALVVDYANNGRRSADTLGWRLKHLRAAFGQDRALAVTEPRIELYKAQRLQAGAAPATVNRELAALRRAFRLAVRQRRLSVAPAFDLLAEHNARQGFIEPADFEAVVAHLPEYLKDAARFAYATGWRRGEVSSLEWADVDRAGQRIALRAEHSKNGEPRILPLAPALAALVERRWNAREYRAADGASGVSRYVFHRAGRPLGDFRKAWATACEAAGRTGLLFHDMRRSAVRNFDRAGVGQAVAMKITGHRTASVYRRYRIVNEDDMLAALNKTAATTTSETTRSVVPIRMAVRG